MHAVVALSLWPSRFYEQYEPTRWVFSTFGLSWGTIIFGLKDIGTLLVLPILALEILEYFERQEIPKIFSFLGWAAIETYGLSSFAFYFLDMYSDAVVMHLVLSGGIGRAPITTTFIFSVRNAVLVAVFVLSFSIRLRRHIKSTQLQNKLSK